MNEITVTMPYYCNSHLLALHVGVWSQYPENVQKHLRFIIVDDGSPRKPALPVLKKVPLTMDIQLFRIHEDKGWNFQGARNLGMTACDTEWALITDIDHVLYADSAEALVTRDVEAGYHYLPSRQWPDGREEDTHATTVLCRRDTYWEAGGVDEAYVGTRGGDGEMRQSIEALTEQGVMPDVTLTLWQSAIPDGHTDTLERGKREKVQRNIIKRKKSNGVLPDKPDDYLRFDWERLL